MEKIKHTCKCQMQPSPAYTNSKKEENKYIYWHCENLVVSVVIQ